MMWTWSQFITMALLVGLMSGTTASGDSGPNISPGSSTLNPNLEFHCNPDDSINVTLTSAEQSYYSVELTCNRSTTLIKTVTSNETFITTCSKGKNVTVTVLKSPTSTPIQSGTPSMIIRNEKTFAFQCTDISSSGIVLFTDTSFNDTIPFAYMGTQKPELQLQMYVTAASAANNKKIRSITIGEKYKLHIDGPDTYAVIPDTCYATDVKSSTETNRNVTIFKNGCSCDNDVLQNIFTLSNTTNQGKVEIEFNGFRLVGSSYVYLECGVYVCPLEGCKSPTHVLSDPVTGCLTPPGKCKTNKRKRRSASQDKSMAIARTAFVVRDSRVIASSAVGKETVTTLFILCGLFFWTFAERYQ